MQEEKIKVAHIIGKWVGGGVESVIMNYYRYIDKNKIQFDFICDSDSTDIPYKEIEDMGGKVVIIPPYQNIIKYHKKLKEVLKKGKYDIVHSHINTLSVFSLFAAKCANIPIRIAHSHSTTNKEEKKKNFLKQILRPYSKIFATNYFACSEYAGRWLFGDKEFNKGNVFILNNAIDTEKFKFNEKIRDKIRKKLNINENTLVIGHIGRFVKQKNHDFLIDIFNEVQKERKNSILLLIGQGPLQENIINKVKKLELQDKVLFLGQQKNVNEIYQAMDVLVLPSLYEGLPVVGVEAQASGLLCIFSDSMTKETKILDTSEFISLNSDTDIWKKRIINSSNYVRLDTTEILIENGFDIRKESLKLEKMYLNIVKNGGNNEKNNYY